MMPWQEHFRKIHDSIQERERDSKLEEEKKIAEMKRINELFTPPIDRVCKEIAKTFRLQYSIHRGGAGYGNIFRVFAGSLVEDVDEFEVTIYNSSIHVHARQMHEYGSDSNFEKSTDIPLGEFNEEKLTQAFENLYNINVDNYTHANNAKKPCGRA